MEVPYDNLPAWLKAAIPTEERKSGANGGRMVFKNGSSIQVATSFRSGTVQRLHISEHGKICAKYPHKAKEVKTGTLNAIHQNAICLLSRRQKVSEAISIPCACALWSKPKVG